MFWLWMLFLLGAGGILTLAACGPQTPRPADTAPRAKLQITPAQSVAIDVRQVRRALTSSEAKDYLGDATCGSCHRQIAASHARSDHAHTLRPVTVAQDGALFRRVNAVKDPENRFTYGTIVQGDRCQLLAFNDKVEANLPADYVLGSGRHAFSYLNRDDRNGWVALRLSYHPVAGRWDFSAGQPRGRPLSTPMGIELDGPHVTACLLCHTTVLGEDSAPIEYSGGRSSARTFPDVRASSLGVGCERCHGPGRAHVEAVIRDRNPSTRSVTASKTTRQTFGMEDLGRATPERINALCGYCHRTPQNTDPRDPA